MPFWGSEQSSVRSPEVNHAVVDLRAAVPEAWVDGHIHAFAFFGAVPQSIVYDNDRCLVAKILPDGTRKRAALFSGFLSR